MKKLFTTIILLGSIGLSSAFTQTNCLMAWYKLDGNAADASGNHLNGTLTGTMPTTGHLGNANGALYFNGLTDKIDLPSSFDFPQRTISLWFNATAFGANGALIYDSDNAGLLYGNTKIWDNANNQIGFGVGNNNYFYNNATLNTWYHVALVAGASYLKFYVNGSIVDSLPNNDFSHSNSGDPFAKIATSRIDDRFFQGTVDEVRIYNCALSSAEISQLYSGQTNCLYGWYKLDGNAADSSGNNLNGMLYGTTPAADHLGNPNSALHFNGVSDQINLPSNFDFPQKTISLWFKSETFLTNYNIIYESDNPYLTYGGTVIMVENGAGINAISFHSSGHLFIYSNAVTANTWYHVAYVITPTYLNSYVNGNLVDSTAYNGYVSSNNGDNYAKIGASRNNDRFFQGVIDDVKIFDCVLSSGEIHDIVHTYIPDFNNELNSVIVYPNPANDNIIIENSSDNQDYIISIKNIQGQEVFKGKTNYNKTYSINIGGLSNGVYILSLQNEKKIAVRKFVKE